MKKDNAASESLNWEGCKRLARAILDLYYETFLLEPSDENEARYESERDSFLRDSCRFWFQVAEREDLYFRWKQLYEECPTLEELRLKYPQIKEAEGLSRRKGGLSVGYSIKELNKSPVSRMKGFETIRDEIRQKFPDVSEYGYYLALNRDDMSFHKVSVSSAMAKQWSRKFECRTVPGIAVKEEEDE